MDLFCINYLVYTRGYKCSSNVNVCAYIALYGLRAQMVYGYVQMCVYEYVCTL